MLYRPAGSQEAVLPAERDADRDQQLAAKGGASFVLVDARCIQPFRAARLQSVQCSVRVSRHIDISYCMERSRFTECDHKYMLIHFLV